MLFNELELVTKAHGGSFGDGGSCDYVLNQILTGMNAKENAFIIGATNRLDHPRTTWASSSHSYA